MMHDGNWNNMGGGGWWWMMILMVVLLSGLIVLAVALIRRPNLAGHASTTHATAQAILAERLARGEIEADEYRSRLDVLNHGKGG